MTKTTQFIVAMLAVASIAGCASRRPAPVSDARPAGISQPATPVPATGPGPSAAAEAPKPALGDKVHVIQKGDTLISVALANGLDYRELAMWNNVENPNVIKLGDTLRLTPPGTAVATAAPPAPGAQPKPGEPVAMPLVITPPPPPETAISNTDKLKTEPKAVKLPYSDAAYAKLSAEAAASAVAPGLAPDNAAPTPTAPAAAAPAIAASEDVDWAWPIQPAPKGKIVATFTDANKGVDISGTKGTPVLASAAGKVVYSGSGLRGYGRLVIIKHNATWLSAYAHNEKVLVTEGQAVKKGEKIAEMGNSDSDAVKLHFEIRKQGKPVDPMVFLPK